MSRVFYHGAYKPPREFNWVIGVILLQLTLLLSFTGYLLPWDQLALWAVTVGTNMMGYTPVFGSQVRFVLLGTKEIGTETLLRWYVLHVLMLPFVDRHLHGHPLLAGPQGRRHLRAPVGRERSRHAGRRGPRTSTGSAARSAEGAGPARPGRGGRRAAAERRPKPRRPRVQPTRPRPKRPPAADGGAPEARPTGDAERRSRPTCWRAPPPAGQPRTAVTHRRRRPPAGGDRRPPAAAPRPPRPRPLRPPPAPGATPSACSPSSRPARSSRPGPRPRTRSTSGRTCWSASSSAMLSLMALRHGLLRARAGAAAADGQLQPDAQPVEGAVVLPRPPGAAHDVPPDGRRRDHPRDGPDHPDDGALHRQEPVDTSPMIASSPSASSRCS